MDLSIGVIVFLIVGAMVAGFVDSICGGGGLLSIPILMTSGITPIQALASNKLQGCVGALSSWVVFVRKGYFEWRAVVSILVFACLFSAVGTLILPRIDSHHLMLLIPVILLLVSIYFLFSSRVSDQASKPRISLLSFSVFVASAIGFYDGFLGAGTGSFFMVSLIALLGFSTTSALAHSKALNFATNLSALIVFIAMGKVVWIAGIAMSGGEMIGAYYGSKLAIQKGSRLIRPLVVITSLLMLLRVVVMAIF